MAQKAPPTKGEEIKRALVDFIFVSLLLTGAGFGGYFYGTMQKLAPVQGVGPGTPGALPPLPSQNGNSQTATTSSPGTVAQANSATASPSAAAAASTSAPKGKTRYWLASSGAEYIGYQITAKINDNTVDSFYGPGKTVDISRFVKSGDNGITFDARLLGSEYNKHQGDAKAILSIQVVKGPCISENFSKSDVLATYNRTATDNGDSNETLHFSAE